MIDCREIVILRFFVRDAYVSNLEDCALACFFKSAPLGTKGVFWASRHPRDNDERIHRPASHPANRSRACDRRMTRLFADVRVRFAMAPNLFRVLANAPAALEGLMALGSALAAGALDEKTREQLALTIAESNLCAYCSNAHKATAAKIGLNQAEIDDAIRASAANTRTDAILKLARSIVVQRGEVPDADLARARSAGLSDGDIVETVANVALNIFENYMSHVARVPIDFPQAESRETSTQENESNRKL